MNKDLIDIRIEDENKLVVLYDGQQKLHEDQKTPRYAFRLFLEKEMVAKKPYSQHTKAEFVLEEQGEYRVKIFEKKVDREVQKITTDPVFFGALSEVTKTYKGLKEVVVKAENVTKKFRLYKKTSDIIKSLFSFNKNIEYHVALKNVSFEVKNGEVIGIIGVNGSGKTTLSNLLAGITIPTEGSLEVKGKALMLAVGTGMNSQLTGLENIKFKCLMMGLEEAKIKEITPAIIEFADIGIFIDQPVKTYSSGMRSRLGFAISVNVDPDILIVDEALAVGDARFTERCFGKIQEFVEKGKTIFFISHSAGQMRRFCTKAIWLHDGRIMKYDDIDLVVDEYKQFLRDCSEDNKKSSELSLHLRIKYGIPDT